MASTRPTSDSPTSGDLTPWMYELVPLHELPEIDLSVSIKTRFVRSQWLLRFMGFMIGSSATFYVYLTSIVVSLIPFVVAAPSGRVIAATGFCVGFFPTLLTIHMLRYEMVAVLLTTYETWFLGALSTVVSIVFAMILNDARGLLMFHSWLLSIFNIFIDANLFNERNVWIGNFLSMVVYVFMAFCVSANITDELRHFNVLSTNANHSLSAVAIVSDGLVSMGAVIIRNVFRQRQHLSTRSIVPSSSTNADSPQPKSQLVTCVSFRCRMQLQLVSSPRTESSPSTSSQIPSHKTRLRFGQFLKFVDMRDTMVPLPQWFWCYNPLDPMQTRPAVCSRMIFKLIGVVGFAALNISIGLQAYEPPLASEPTILFFSIVGSSCSLVFTAVCVAMFQRQLLWAVVTSFDFVFIAAQIIVTFLSVSDMCRWERTILMPLFVDWVWTMWAMCWDAMTPAVRSRLGVSHRFSAFIGTALIVFVIVNGVVIFFIVPLHTVNDRALWHMDLWGHRIEFNPVSWYFSCIATIIASSIRVAWRKWRACENELVSLDGPVVFERPPKRHTSRMRQGSRRLRTSAEVGIAP